LLKKVIEKELAILDAFTDGSALLQHMEDFYYKALLKVGSATPFSVTRPWTYFFR
jgi:hypothetical protein